MVALAPGEAARAPAAAAAGAAEGKCKQHMQHKSATHTLRTALYSVVLGCGFRVLVLAYLVVARAGTQSSAVLRGGK